MNFKSALILTCAMVTAYLNLAAAEEALPTPDCKLSSIDQAKQINLRQYRGKVVYLDFWASWCGPCLDSFPFMNKMENQLKDKGLVVLAVNLDENLEDGKHFLDQHPVDFAVAVDSEQECAKQFQLKAMPSSYVIDRNGQIRTTHTGFRTGDADRFRNLVEDILMETSVKP